MLIMLAKKFVVFVKEWRYRNRLRHSAIKEGKTQAMANNGFVYYCRVLDLYFFLPEYESDYIQQKIITSGNYYEYNILNYITIIVLGGAIRERIMGHCLLDIGSNIGNHTLYFLKECGAGVIHCFEPVDKTFDILKRNLSLNHYEDRVVLHHVAVGARSSKAVLKHCEKGNMGTAEMAYDNHGNISMIAVDDLDLSSSIAFVKIDVEGFELEVVKGMKETIKRNRPYIMMEIRKDFFGEIMSILHPLGYWYINVGTGINYLFIPL